MCGIAGFWAWQRRDYSVGSVLTDMTETLIHRGPNDGGGMLFDVRGGEIGKLGSTLESSADLALGHRRLSILDLSERGHQPMADPKAQVWIVYNGEVYNYVELREELRAFGHVFTSGTDTEVVLAAYLQWGTHCLERFNGMWAFALWDARKKVLFCARDRLGIKPFYYYNDRQAFVFGSEVKAVRIHPAVRVEPNDGVIHDYLSLGYVDHTPETFFSGIERLPAAHFMLLEPHGKLTIERYWDISPSQKGTFEKRQLEHLVEGFESLFTDAVRIRLRSDVPVGTCLSGGLDSSSIVAVANQLMFDSANIDPVLVGARQKTFSGCFEDPRFDEREFIELVLAQTGAASHYTFASGDRIWDDMDTLLHHMDEPFQSTSQYSQFNVFRRVSDGGVTVTLDGQGADEMMAGYPGYYGVLLTSLARRGRIGALVREFRAAATMGGRGRSAGALLSRLVYGVLPFGLKTFVRSQVNRFDRTAVDGPTAQLLQPSFEQQFGYRRQHWLREQNRNLQDLSARLRDDLFRFSLPALLRYEDRNSMTFSIESRTPFLDYRLVEYCFSLPTDMMIQNGWTKWVLRKAMDGRIPKPIQWRKDKKGFVTPEVIWLRAGADRIRSLFDGSPKSAAYLNTDVVRRSLDDILARQSEGSFYTQVWRWINLEMWLQRSFA